MSTAENFQSGVVPGAASILVVALSALGIAAFTGMIPGPVAHQDAYDVAADGVMPAVFDVPPCAACGVVEEIRAYHVPAVTATHPATDIIAAIAWANGGETDNAAEPSGNGNGKLRYLVSIRMQDGSERVVTHAAPLLFMVGDPVRLSKFGRLVSDRSSQG